MNKAFEKIIDELKQESIIVDDDAGHRAVDIIEQISEEYNGGWIPCSERLPEENKDGWTHLILSIKTGEVIFGFWHNEEMGFCKHFRDGVCRVCGVIAWMPLPEPFEERD